MRAALKWTVWLVLGLLVVLALFIVFGMNVLRGPIERAVTEATGRELRIEGGLRPAWNWVYPRFRAEGVSFRNEIVVGPGGSQILAEDPSGNVVELFQPAAWG